MIDFIKRHRELLISLAIPLIVGGASALLSGGTKVNPRLETPPLMPPEWVFPVVWAALYLLMGYGSYLIYKSRQDGKGAALLAYGAQLFANFLWSILFFRFEFLLGTLIDAVILWALAILMVWLFADINKKAAILQIPYVLWLTFATYLSFGFWALN
ncbi:MAG: tryptophan-rich sensory protein [Oscillospiraceae bacterium]|nr:tryptophan-rich sensory protein [Oscillospiraceae bacterium]